MAKPGTKPTPTALKKLRGNPGRRPLPKNEPVAEGRPVCPAYLSDYAKTEWRYIVPLLDDMGIIGKVDRGVLVSYCEAYSMFRQAVEALERELNSPVIRTHNGNYVQNPWVSIKNRAAQDMLKYAAELGMTPSARTRIRIEQRDEEPSLFEEFQAAMRG